MAQGYKPLALFVLSTSCPCTWHGVKLLQILNFLTITNKMYLFIIKHKMNFNLLFKQKKQNPVNSSYPQTQQSSLFIFQFCYCIL